MVLLQGARRDPWIARAPCASRVTIRGDATFAIVTKRRTTVSRRGYCCGSTGSQVGDTGALILLRYKPPSGERGLVVVRTFLRSPRQRDLLAFDSVVRNQREQERDHIQTGTALVIGSDDMPRRDVGVVVFKHRTAP